LKLTNPPVGKRLVLGFYSPCFLRGVIPVFNLVRVVKGDFIKLNKIGLFFVGKKKKKSILCGKRM
jgi:hypothetical protein